MMDAEKWRLWNAIDYFLDKCLDVDNVDDIFELYENMKTEIWCPKGEHEMVPDHCGMLEHNFCKYCGIRQDTLESLTPLTKSE